ncbi:hypothetical protein PDIG_14690 [Penicillium digitatum PHI26]|uniref:Uncharacterized protein n=2 Tax=Penicillium digitatum TaxID=36651 RepID=K9G7W5_PEND2|nr:hypothetical protein PDIP_02180 [Penicillium digitatum Pd1]EKV17454.1 hypothetical protein PDIG_14690 [Penicillium digitatum PHI26]EKV21903.1 hypothetical protein PDIP_02180 [Penicillium digitatum Pd1]
MRIAWVFKSNDILRQTETIPNAARNRSLSDKQPGYSKEH